MQLFTSAAQTQEIYPETLQRPSHNCSHKTRGLLEKSKSKLEGFYSQAQLKGVDEIHLWIQFGTW